MTEGNHWCWREFVSRAAMVVLALMLLAGTAGCVYAVVQIVTPFGAAGRHRGGYGGGMVILLGAVALALGAAGLFLLKHALLPGRGDTTPPQVRTGDRWGDAADDGPWWYQYLAAWWW